MTEHPVRLDEVYEFCAARLDDTERLAQAAAQDGDVKDGRWYEDEYEEVTDDKAWRIAHSADPGARAHIAQHDPAHVLKDVAFKRNLLAEHEPSLVAAVKGDEMTPMTVCGLDGDDCPFTQGLAALYADHPDYKEDWRP